MGPKAGFGPRGGDDENVLISMSQFDLSYKYDGLTYFVLYDNVLILS